jgi:hypothetical protein
MRFMSGIADSNVFGLTSLADPSLPASRVQDGVEVERHSVRVRREIAHFIPIAVFISLIAIILMLSPLVPRANALPIFARKYQTSCMTCHEMMPRLNAFGEAFRLNGYRWPDGKGGEVDDQMRKQEPVPLGSKAHKEEFPKSVWPVDIPGGVPLSIRFIPTFAKAGDRTLDWEWELETVGSIGEKESFFGHVNFVTVSGTDTSVQSKLSLIGHLNLEKIFKNSHLVNLQVGIVGVEEANFFNYRSHSTNMLLPPSARTFARLDTLPYPTGFAKPDVFKLRRGPGAMLWGFTRHSSYSAGYRIGDQDGGGSDMNVGFFHWAYKIGGGDNFGSTKQSYPWAYMERSLSFGVLGDVGSVGVRAKAADSITRDQFWRFGGDMRLKLGSWAYRAGAITGSNSRPYGTLSSGSVDYTTWFTQTEYHVLPWLLPEIRYEGDSFRLPAGMNLGRTARTRFVPSISALYGANVRFTIWSELFTKSRIDLTGRKVDRNLVGFLVDFVI